MFWLILISIYSSVVGASTFRGHFGDLSLVFYTEQDESRRIRGCVMSIVSGEMPGRDIIVCREELGFFKLI